MHPRWLTFLLVCCALAAGAAAAPPHATCSADGVALGGFDVVSYFEPGGPVAGRRELAVAHAELTYVFASEAHRAAFVAAPARFLPAYGGWCATTIAHGALRCPDFRNFKIEDGRLLLFETTGFTNGRAVWDSDPAGYRRRADAEFRALGLAAQ